jgi:hypothetical protein
MGEKAACFGILYDRRAKECQICDYSIECWKKLDVPKKKLVGSGYAIAILTFILREGKVTVEEIKADLKAKFDKDLNIHYYLGLLKEQGLIDMKIQGRKRYYVLR